MREAVIAQTTSEKQLARAKAEGWGYDGSMATETEVLHLLTALVHITKPEVCVETGTYNGHGTKAIQAGLVANDKGHLWTIEADPEISKQLEDFELERVTFVSGDSIKWTGGHGCPGEIDFAFVDCCEKPEGRVTVFSYLLPRMNEGGLICAHDTAFYRDVDYLDEMVDIAGPYTMHFPALNGFTVWQR